MQQVERGVAAVVERLRQKIGWRGDAAEILRRGAELRGGGVVYQEEVAVAVLHRHGCRQQANDLAQYGEFGAGREACQSRRTGGVNNHHYRQVGSVGINGVCILHGPTLANTAVALVKSIAETGILVVVVADLNNAAKTSLTPR